MVALTVAAGLLAAEPIPREIVVERGSFKRFIQLQPRLRTTRIENACTGEVLRVDVDTPEFLIETIGGGRFTTDDFVVRSNESGKIILEFTRGGPHRIVVEHPGTSNGTIARRLTLEGFGDLQRLAVEAMKLDARTELGGLGRPLFLNDRWFLGLEHPAGINAFDPERGCILLQQYPSRNESMTAVLGGLVSREDRLDDAFERYIDSIRKSKPKPLLQYNTWYDLRGAELTPDNAKNAAQLIHDKLLTPFNLNLHSFVLDDGWQEPKSLWEPQGRWKHELPHLAAFLNRNRAKLGLWMPLNGASLDVSWGEIQGFDRTNFRKPCYCLSSRQYRSRLLDRMRGYQLLPASFFKHDFNYLTCSADGHSHLPTPQHGREANVEGQVELLDAMDTASAVTSNAWPSPYWLKHSEFLWIGSYDYAEDWNVPSWSKRQAETTFRDQQIHRLLRIDRTPVPMNALMTHGLILGRHEGVAADRDLNDWSDYVMMFLGRGVMLQELYISPELLGDEEWNVLGAALQWADQRTETLRHTRMIGGRPDDGEPYGYIHWSADLGIVCLRNPSPRPTTFSVSSLERPQNMPRHSQWTAIQIYPDRRKLPDFTPNQPWTVSLSGHEVAIVEFHAGASVREIMAKVPVGRLQTSGEKRGVVNIDSVDTSSTSLTVVRNDPDRLDWTFEARANADEEIHFTWWTKPEWGVVASVKPDESAVSPSDVSGPRWALHRTKFSPETIATSMKLPWSPFWPQEASASAVVRTCRNAKSDRVVALPLPLGALPEVRPSHRDAVVEEILVLDGWRFHRRRSSPEKLAWLTALGLAPITLIGVAGRRLGLRWGRPKIAVGVATALLLAIYTLTPLGGAVGRVLSEF